MVYDWYVPLVHLSLRLSEVLILLLKFLLYLLGFWIFRFRNGVFDLLEDVDIGTSVFYEDKGLNYPMTVRVISTEISIFILLQNID